MQRRSHLKASTAYPLVLVHIKDVQENLGNRQALNVTLGEQQKETNRLVENCVISAMAEAWEVCSLMKGEGLDIRLCVTGWLLTITLEQ